MNSFLEMLDLKISFALIVFFLVSCTYRNEEELIHKCNSSSSLTFSDVQPIFQAKCNSDGCHNGSRPSIPTLISHDEIKRNMLDCSSQIGNGAMPPSDVKQLTDFEKFKILCWIENGAK